MALLHDPTVRASLENRLRTLTPSSPRRWGKMTIDQMLHHVNHALAGALGREPMTLQADVPLPKAVMKFFVLHVPWPRGAPTAKEWISQGERYDFAAEQQRALTLIAEVVAKPIDAPDWPRHNLFGDVGGKYWSQINAKHLDHHLRQFNG
jgi:hypothetical protein